MGDRPEPFGDEGTDELDLSLADMQPMGLPPDVPGSPEGDMALAADARELVEACERQLARKPEAARAARLHYEIARLYEGPLGDPRRSADHYRDAAKLLPDHVPSLRGARRTALAAGEPKDAVALFDAEIRVTGDPRSRADLLHQKGRLLEDELGMTEKARESYLAALELDPRNVSVSRAVERCERQREAWTSLIASYESLAASVGDDRALRSAFMAERARLVEERLDDAAAAAQLYEAAVEASPESPEALSELIRLARSGKLWSELARAFERMAAGLPDPGEQALALHRLARVRHAHLGDPRGALEALARAWALLPRDRAIGRELAELQESLGASAEVAAVWEQLFGTAASDEEKGAIALRLGHLYDGPLADREKARAWYEAVLAHDPGDMAALEALIALYERAEDHQSLARTLLAEAEATGEEERRADLHVRVGELYERFLGRLDEGTAQYSTALGLVPDHEGAFRALARLHTQAQRWRELAELYERRVDKSGEDDLRAVAWLTRVGAIYEDHLDDPPGAAHAYRRALERDAGNVGALLGLQRVTERGEMWEELVRALDAEAERAEGPRAVRLGLRAAEVLDRHLEDEGGAIARLREVLAREPKHAPALRMLGELYLRARRWDDLLDNAERIVELTPRDEQIGKLYRLGELCRTRVGDEGRASTYFQRVLEIDPAHEPSHRALARSLLARQDWPALAALWEMRSGALPAPLDNAHLDQDLGELHEERLGDADKALAAYERAIDAMPSFWPALDARVRLLAEQRAWPRLAEVLGQEAETATDPLRAIDARMRQAEVLAHRVCDLRAAIGAFEQVLRLREGHPRALLALEDLYQRVRDRDGLARTLERQSRAFTDDGARAASIRELARVRAADSDDEGAERAWKALLEIAPADLSALEALARSAAGRGDRAASVRLESSLASAAADQPALAAYHQARVAEMLEATGLPDALAAYRAALALDPESLSAARGFTRVARRAGDPTALRETARREAQVTRDQELAVELLLRAADIRRQRNDLAGAAEDLAEALELAPGHPDAAAELERVMVLAGRVPELVERLGRAADRATPAERAASLHVQVARLHAYRREDMPAAIAAVERALEAAPRHLSALSELATYHEQAGHYREAVRALLNLALRSTEPRHLIDAHLRLAQLAEERLKDVGRARKSLEEVLDRDPANRAALARLARLHQREGRQDEAIALARKLVESAESERDRAAALVEVGRIENARNRPAEAAAAFLEAVAVQGPSGESAVAYRDLIGRSPEQAGWEAFSKVLSKHLERAGDDRRVVSRTLVEMARIQAEELGRIDEAITTLRDGTGRLRGDDELAVALAQRLRQKGAHGEALRELERALDIDVRSPRTWRELSETLRASGDPGEAMLALVPLRALDAATPEELVTLRGLPVRPAQARPGLLGDAGFREIQVSGAVDSVATALMGAVAEGLAKAYPPDMTRYGVGRRDKLGPRTEHPLRTVADRVAEIFGAGEFDLYLHDAPGGEVRVELGSTPAIMMPTWAQQLSHAQLVYLLGVPLGHMARGTHPLLRIPERELPLVLAAAARVAAPGFGAGLAPENDLEERSRLVQKGVPRRDRRRFEESAAAYASRPPQDVFAWARAMRRTAARASLLVCDDLFAALEIVRRTAAEPIGPDNQATDLLRFWVSDPARRFRRARG